MAGQEGVSPERRRLSRLSRSIEGSVALVTGAASGMGRATAHLFADEGARVAVVDRAEDGATAVADEITNVGGEAQAWGCDVADPEAIRALVADVVGRFGGIDILVNNAGVSLPAGAETPDDAFEPAWERTLAVNLTAQVRLARACLPHLRASAAPRIVNIASTEALVATAGIAAYTASKHGVVGLTRSLASELGRHGVTVNCICPGPIRTGMTALIPEEMKAEYARRRVPLRRYGEPEEVAHATLSLVLPASSFVNGAVLAVDGGMHIRG
jgi:3-oxoacyl-[acyl-carrier protein] reductase